MHKTVRVGLISFFSCIAFCVLTVCVPLITWKYLDDPGWVKILLAALAPNSIFAPRFGFLYWRLRPRLRVIQARVQSTAPPPATGGTNQSPTPPEQQP